MEAGGKPVNMRSDGLQPLGSVPDGVGCCHIGEQRLRGADIGSRLIAADMLLARLQGEAVTGTAMGIHGLADETARHEAREPIRDGAIGSMWPAESHGNTETLHRTHRDLRAK